MDAVADVLLRDLGKAPATFLRAFCLCLPFATLGVIVGTVRFRLQSRRLFVRAVVRGLVAAMLGALAIAMVTELLIHWDSFRSIRKSFPLHFALLKGFLVAAGAFWFGYREARQLARRWDHPFWLWPRWKSFTLRYLLVGQLVLASVLGWWLFTRRDRIEWQSARLRLTRLEHAAQSRLGEFGWHVYPRQADDDGTFGLGITPHDGGPLGPQWLGPQPLVSDAVLGELAQFAPILYLQVQSDLVTDAGAASIADLTDLRTLLISSAALTDEGVAELASLPRMKVVQLDAPQATDAALVYLANNKSLRILALDRNAMTSAGLAHFKAVRPDVTVAGVAGAP